jgi:hypothetical protein
VVYIVGVGNVKGNIVKIITPKIKINITIGMKTIKINIVKLVKIILDDVENDYTHLNNLVLNVVILENM